MDNTKTDYGWSYIVGWLGVAMSTLGTVLYLCAAYSVSAAEKEEKVSSYGPFGGCILMTRPVNSVRINSSDLLALYIGLHVLEANLNNKIEEQVILNQIWWHMSGFITVTSAIER